MTNGALQQIYTYFQWWFWLRMPASRNEVFCQRPWPICHYSMAPMDSKQGGKPIIETIFIYKVDQLEIFWLYMDGWNLQVGGYVQQYTGFTFLSVRGAGHMVPSFQPERALIMLHSFLKGTLPPYIQEQWFMEWINSMNEKRDLIVQVLQRGWIRVAT